MQVATRAVPILFALVLVSQPLQAQAVDLTDDRTAEEKWTRCVYLLDIMVVGLIAHGKSLGQTAEQTTEWVIGFAAPSWGTPGSRTMASFVRGMFRNYNLYNNLEFEILSESESEIRGRMNRPFAARFEETGEVEGVTLQEFQGYYTGFYEGTADYLGFDMTHEVDGEWVTFTVKTR
jgi:hypothetical protein